MSSIHSALSVKDKPSSNQPSSKKHYQKQSILSKLSVLRQQATVIVSNIPCVLNDRQVRALFDWKFVIVVGLHSIQYLHNTSFHASVRINRLWTLFPVRARLIFNSQTRFALDGSSTFSTVLFPLTGLLFLVPQLQLPTRETCQILNP